MPGLHITSRPVDRTVQAILEAYSNAYDVLSTTSDFSPRNPNVNRVLSALVGSLSLPMQADAVRTVLVHPAISGRLDRMWNYLSRAEAEMEMYFGQKLGRDTYRHFMYYQNYEMLVDAELKQLPFLERRLGNDRSIVFVGAGALPLTAILMHQKTGQSVTCIDCDPQAVRIGREFILRCGFSAGVTYRLDAGETYDYSHDSTVFIASLVGDKNTVIDRILKCTRQNHMTIAVRSAEGVHALLYQPVDETVSNAQGLFFNRRSVTTPEIINTTLFAEIPARANFNEAQLSEKKPMSFVTESSTG